MEPRRRYSARRVTQRRGVWCSLCVCVRLVLQRRAVHEGERSVRRAAARLLRASGRPASGQRRWGRPSFGCGVRFRGGAQGEPSRAKASRACGVRPLRGPAPGKRPLRVAPSGATSRRRPTRAEWLPQTPPELIYRAPPARGEVWRGRRSYLAPTILASPTPVGPSGALVRGQSRAERERAVRWSGERRTAGDPAKTSRGGTERIRRATRSLPRCAGADPTRAAEELQAEAPAASPSPSPTHRPISVESDAGEEHRGADRLEALIATLANDDTVCLKGSQKCSGQ